MFSKVLDCPVCKHRFNYDHEGSDFPERITCPSCRNSSKYSDYSALTFCPQCRAKLKIPLDIIFDSDLSCPSCGTMLNAVGTFADETAASTMGGSNVGNSTDRRQLYKRMLQDGDIFDKYKIIRLLGKGGMAEVYLAEHLLLKQLCAVKLMRSNMGTDSDMAVKRFLREAKLSHQFDHPNIVKVFDVGSDFQTGYLFIAMEYVDGKTLHELAKEKPFSEDELAKVLVSMANALNSLLEARVVHRDIKPSNIMLTNDGVYKLMDLGIAKSESNSHVAGDMTLTLEQSTIGTPNYASPEQCRSAHNVDYRSDIYSLGATLYHLASGKLPFTGTTAVETILNVMQTEAEPLRNHRPDLSDKMIGIIEQMMRKNPLERPQLPDALLAAVYSTGKTSWFDRVKKFLPGKKADKPLKRKKYKIIISSAVAVVLLVVIGINVKYTVNAYRSNPNVREIFSSGQKTDKVETKAEGKKDVLAQYHPMMTFPYAYGDLSKKVVWDKKCKKYIFPVVKFASDDKKSLVRDYDFEKSMPPSPDFDKSVVKNGVAYLDRKPYSKTLQNGKSVTLMKKTFILLPELSDFTLSVDFSSGRAAGRETLMDLATAIRVELYEQEAVLFVNGHGVPLKLYIADNEWANITLIYYGGKRKLNVLSGDRLLGSFITPEINSLKYGSNKLTLGVSGFVKSSNVRFDRIKFYNCAREIILPENTGSITCAPAVTGTRQQISTLKENIVSPEVAVAVQPEQPAKTVADSSSTNTVIPADSPLKFSADGKTVTGVKDESITQAIIPHGVEKIAANAFKNCKELTAVVLPDTLKTIGGWAFYNTHKLAEMNFPDRLKNIGPWAINAGNLQNVILPPEVILAEGAIAGIRSLEPTQKPRHYILTGDFLISENWKLVWTNPTLTSVTVPANAEILGGSCFGSRNKLKNIIIPDTVREIKGWAFSGCDELEDLTIPDSVKQIGTGVFRFTTHLRKLSVPGRFSETDAKQWEVPEACIVEFRGRKPVFPAGDTLDSQLKQSQLRSEEFAGSYAKMRSELSGKVASMTPARAEAYRSIVDCAGKMLPEWRQRLRQLENRNRNIEAAKKRKYDSSSDQQVQEAFKVYTAQRRDWGYGRKDIDFSRKLQQMLKDSRVDPNVKLTDSTYARYNGVALHAVSSGRIPELEKIHAVLCARYADPLMLGNTAISAYNYTPTIIEYGLPHKAIKRAMDYKFGLTVFTNKPDGLVNIAKNLFFDGGEFTVEHLKAAVRYNNAELVTLILASGMDCNERDNLGETALFTACRMPDNNPVRRLLLAAGCDQNITNKAGKTVKEYTNVAKFVKYFQLGKISECRIMLRDGIDPNTRLANGNTLLIEASAKGNLAMVKLLLNYKADVDLKASRRDGALAAAFDKIKFYRSYRQKGDLRRENKDYIDIVKALVAAGANVGDNPRGYGGKSLNFIYYLVSRCKEDNVEIFADLIDFMLDYTGNFESVHWSSIPRCIERLPKNFPARVKDKLLRKMPEDLRKK